jgi:hypothetical protein
MGTDVVLWSFGRKTWWQDLGVDGSIILKWFFKNCDGKSWTGLLLLRIETGGRRLWMQDWTLGFYKYGEFLGGWTPVGFSGTTLPIELVIVLQYRFLLLSDSDDVVSPPPSTTKHTRIIREIYSTSGAFIKSFCAAFLLFCNSPL